MSNLMISNRTATSPHQPFPIGLLDDLFTELGEFDNVEGVYGKETTHLILYGRMETSLLATVTVLGFKWIAEHEIPYLFEALSNMPNLTSLAFISIQFTPEHFKTLVVVPTLSNLQSLHLASKTINPQNTMVLTTAPTLSNLTSLCISGPSSLGWSTSSYCSSHCFLNNPNPAHLFGSSICPGRTRGGHCYCEFTNFGKPQSPQSATKLHWSVWFKGTCQFHNINQSNRFRSI